MLRKIQLILIVVLSIIIVLGVMAYVGKGKEINELKDEKNSIRPEEKNVVSKEFTQDEVKSYEKLVKKKLDNFQQKKLSEGEFNTNNSGVETVRYIFPSSQGKVITEKDDFYQIYLPYLLSQF